MMNVRPVYRTTPVNCQAAVFRPWGYSKTLCASLQSRPLFRASRLDAAVAKDAVARWQRCDRVRLPSVVGGRTAVVAVYCSVGRVLRQHTINRRGRCQRHRPMRDVQQRYLYGAIVSIAWSLLPPGRRNYMCQREREREREMGVAGSPA